MTPHHPDGEAHYAVDCCGALYAGLYNVVRHERECPHRAPTRPVNIDAQLEPAP